MKQFMQANTAILSFVCELPLQALVTQDSLNKIMGLMSFNWKEILTCRPNCIWLKTILVLLLANWSGRVGARQVWQDQWCPCGNILNILQVVMNRWNKGIRGLARWRNMQHEETLGYVEVWRDTKQHFVPPPHERIRFRVRNEKKNQRLNISQSGCSICSSSFPRSLNEWKEWFFCTYF